MALTLHGTVSDNTVALDRKTATPIIINGDMQIAQRGTSNSGVTSEGYHDGPDRWKLLPLGTVTISQSTDTPTGQGFKNSYKIDVTTADTSLASGDNSRFMTFLEGQNIQMFNKGNSGAENFTISFWIKSSKTGTYVMELVDDNSRHCCKTYTVSSANTWEKKVVSIPNETSNAIDDDNTLGLQVYWWLAGGSDFTSGTLATAWASQVNANRAVGLNVNCYDSTDNEIYITGVQMEVGDFDSNNIPPFQFEDVGTSLARCQRYCCLMKPNATFTRFTHGFANSTSQAEGVVHFPVSMRGSVTLVTSGTASDYGCQVAGATGTCSSVPVVGNNSTTNPFFQDVYFAQSGLTSNGPQGLVARTTDGILRFEAEL